MSRPTLALFQCGKCPKRYLFRHVCVTTRSRGKTRLKPALRFTCGGCGKEHGNPLTHRCVIKTDYGKRLAAAKRRAKAAAKAERRKKRRAEAAARKRAAAARRKAAALEQRKARAAKPTAPREPRHEPRTCSDPECTKYGCVHWRDGYAAGQLDCPYDHPGDTP